MVVVALDPLGEPISRQKLGGDPGILGQHQIGVAQHI
jgi:hypothetical protein